MGLVMENERGRIPVRVGEIAVRMNTGIVDKRSSAPAHFESKRASTLGQIVPILAKT